MLTLSNLSLTEGGVAHLAQVTASFTPCTLTTILGRTGAGKTSMMWASAGLLTPDGGKVPLAGADWTRLPPRKRPVTMVTQQFINYPHLNLRDNVAFLLVRARVARPEAHHKAVSALTRVGLAALLDRRPSELSGGQQQRVTIARLLWPKGASCNRARRARSLHPGQPNRRRGGQRPANQPDSVSPDQSGLNLCCRLMTCLSTNCI